VSVTVEGGVGAEEKVKIGKHEAKIGVTVKGEATASSKGLKVAVAAELSAEAGPVKAFSVRAEQVTRNEEGASESPTLEGHGPGLVHGNGEASGTTEEFTVSVSSYEGFGGGVSVTVRPNAIFDADVNWLVGHPSPGADFNTNQSGMGAFQ
jgi:hypothetical protein